MNERGQYGKTHVGAEVEHRGHSIGTWIVGGLVVGGAVLWAKHQSAQIKKLYATADLPYQSFGQDLRAQTGALATSAGKKIHSLGRRFGTKSPVVKSLDTKKEP